MLKKMSVLMQEKGFLPSCQQMETETNEAVLQEESEELVPCPACDYPVKHKTLKRGEWIDLVCNNCKENFRVEYLEKEND